MSNKLSFVENISDKRNFVKNPHDYVILFKGNSITRHGFNELTIEKLGWDHISGMAASSSAYDYAHLFTKMVQKELLNRQVKLFFGRGGRPDLAIADVEAETALNPDLVIVQGGEHSACYTHVVNFESDYLKLISAIKDMPSQPQIIAIGIWNPRSRPEFATCTAKEYDECAKRIEKIQRQIATAMNICFVAVSPYENDFSNTGTGKNPEVRWHPNDNGMKCYSKAAFSAWKYCLNSIDTIGMKLT